MRITLTHRTPDEDTVWGPLAFVGCIGQRVPCYVDGRSIGDLLILSAKVIEDGHAAVIIYDGPIEEELDVTPYHSPLFIRD